MSPLSILMEIEMFAQKTRRIIVVVPAFLLLALAADAADDLPLSPTNRAEAPVALIPYPRDVEWGKGDVDLGTVSPVVPANPAGKGDLDLVGVKLRDLLARAGCRIADSGVAITLAFGPVPGSEGCREAYRLTCSGGAVTITAPETPGLFYGVQTLRQLIRQKDGRPSAPCCTITDWPAFHFRGFMHDVGRNYQTVAFLKKQLDFFARYKLNVFHFHLTDNPGFRIESRTYPQLNEKKNYRATRNPGKFYTYAEINELIGFCRDRHIMVIPEIDMPGHSEYFAATFGTEMQSEEGLPIVEAILSEFCDHVDLPFFHIGSDEVRIKNPDFLRRVTALLRGRGKDVIVWRPGGLPDVKVITQLWARGTTQNIEDTRFLDSRANYVNHMDPLVGPVRAFMQQPCRRERGDDLALGGILCCWPDNNITDEKDTLRQTPVFPVMLAFAERIWRGARRNHEEYWAKLPRQGAAAFEEYEAFERDLIDHRDRFFAGEPFPYVRQTRIPWKLIGPFDHEGRFDAAFGPENGIREEYEINGKIFKWRPGDAIGGTIHINHFFGFAGHLPKSARGTVYAATRLHSDRERNVGFWIQFGTPSTSARRNGGNPPSGRWSSFDSRIWINGKEIAPPAWQNPGPLGPRQEEKEIAFTNEGYHFREPTTVRLKEGWNEILVRAPFGKAPGYRGGKWMFTCVPVLWDGGRVSELDGVRFGALSVGR